MIFHLSESRVGWMDVRPAGAIGGDGHYTRIQNCSYYGLAHRVFVVVKTLKRLLPVNVLQLVSQQQKQQQQICQVALCFTFVLFFRFRSSDKPIAILRSVLASHAGFQFVGPGSGRTDKKQTIHPTYLA